MPPRGLPRPVGIFELLVTTDEIRQLVHERASSWEIQQAAVAQGHAHAPRGRLAERCLPGSTTIDEVLRVTKGEDELDGRSDDE